MFAGDIFHRVAFIEDHSVIVWQDTPTQGTDGEIAKEEGVVDDEDLRVLNPSSRGVVIAGVEVRALPSHAVSGIARHFVPDLVRRSEGETAQGTIGALIRPTHDFFELFIIGLVGKQASHPRLGNIQSAFGKVVPSPLDQDRCELARDHRVEQG